MSGTQCIPMEISNHDPEENGRENAASYRMNVLPHPGVLPAPLTKDPGTPAQGDIVGQGTAFYMGWGDNITACNQLGPVRWADFHDCTIYAHYSYC